MRAGQRPRLRKRWEALAAPAEPEDGEPEARAVFPAPERAEPVAPAEPDAPAEAALCRAMPPSCPLPDLPAPEPRPRRARGLPADDALLADPDVLASPGAPASAAIRLGSASLRPPGAKTPISGSPGARRVVVASILALRVSSRTSPTCASVIRVTTVPELPARAVRPERCR